MDRTFEEDKKARLHEAIEKMPKGLVDLLAPVMALATRRNDVKAIFLTRALRALVALVEDAPVEEATAAPSDYDLFLTLLTQPEVMQVLPSRDPLAEAKVRGLLAKRQLLSAEGGCMSSQEVATALGITRQAVEKRRISGKLIGLPSGRVYLYPTWQFAETGQTLPGLERILKSLNVRNPWMQTSWMLNGNTRLEGRPLDVLRQGNLDAVVDAASLYAEQGAA
jgi:hypothetical protein